MTSLGICIPTYKRPDFLRRCIQSVIASASGLPVRIFVSDDSLDDTNEAVYRELSPYAVTIVIHRNEKNLGIDDNIQRVVELCDADYAWLVGEDDYFLAGALRRVHERLQRTRPPFLFANYAYAGDQSDRILGRALDASDSDMPAADFISRHLWAAGFIGSCVVDRRKWGSTHAAPYSGTYYTHVGRICELMSRSNQPVPIVGDVCVANRVEGTDTFTWKRDSYGVFFGFKRMCEAVARECPGLADATTAASMGMERRYGWLSLRLAMRLRSELAYDIHQYRKYLDRNTPNIVKRWAFMLISVAPPSLFKPLVYVYRRMRSNPAASRT